MIKGNYFNYLSCIELSIMNNDYLLTQLIANKMNKLNVWEKLASLLKEINNISNNRQINETKKLIWFIARNLKIPDKKEKNKNLDYYKSSIVRYILFSNIKV